jgi:hypothetical protein
MTRIQLSGNATMDGSNDLDALFAELEAGLGQPEEPPAPQGTPDQREAKRLAPEELAREVRVTVRGAAEAKAINVSETGVLAETTSRLRPGTVVELILTFDGVRRMLRATIVRSMVHSLNPTTFRTAFKFEERTTLPERR